jgi:GNAT superfamily N-acetyltransferase
MVVNLLSHVHESQGFAAMVFSQHRRSDSRQAKRAPIDLVLPEAAVLRDELGASAALWADAHHQVEADRWVAKSSAPTVDYNLVVCHGPHESGVVAQSVEEIGAGTVPTVLALAGEALGSAQPVVDAGWVCVGERAFMARPGRPSTADPAVRLATHDELPAVRAVLAETFETTPELAMAAVPDPATWPPGTEIWLCEEDGGIRAMTAAVPSGSGLGIWSTATLPGHQGHGFGRRLLETMLDASSADHSVLQSSVAGEPFYRSLGYQVVERWQQWSRPRWVLGRT